MLTVSQVSKSYAGRVLFEDLSLQVNRSERMGLIGANGAGKSTLFRIILGEEPPDSGSVVWQRGARVGFLPQETAPSGDLTVLELATDVRPGLAQKRRLLQAMESGDKDFEAVAYEDARASLEEAGGHQLDAQARRILAGLAFREADVDQPTAKLSGGWVMRAHLARLLVMEPDLLMLDEPTNHLDLHTLWWFRDYLKTYPGGILVISHDRDFLNVVTNGMIEIRGGQLHRYQGNFDTYLEQRVEREAQQIAAFDNQQREIQRLERFVERFRAKASKASQAQSKLKELQRMERLTMPTGMDPQMKGFRFPQPERSGHRVLRVEHVHFAYPGQSVYEGINFEVERGQRIVLVGPNGAGKSTLLKLMAQVLKPSAGQVELGLRVEAGYFAQHRAEMFDVSRTVLEEASVGIRNVSEQQVRTLLGAFLFRGEDVFKNVGVLSGGEKSRLALAKLLLNPPNLLLMDEPTTHLDMPSIDALIEALKQYEGALVFISHDVHFIRALANAVLHVDSGKLQLYPGDYSYFLEKTGQSSQAGLTSGRPDAPQANAPAEKGASKVFKTKEQKRAEAEARKAVAAERRHAQEKLSHVEKQIEALEQKQQELATQLEAQETYDNANLAVRLNRELSLIVDQLEELNASWAELAEHPALAQAE
ncbi:MAG: ABC-F family ATP-binding cassette domain-containing protein [Verrucomicrobiales bacterium]